LEALPQSQYSVFRYCIAIATSWLNFVRDLGSKKIEIYPKLTSLLSLAQVAFDGLMMLF
jgi:hypothetical protein